MNDMSSDAKSAVEQSAAAVEEKKRSRKNRAFPAGSFQDALELPTEIFKFGSGQKVRRMSLFEHLNRSPESGPTRQLITNSQKYGLTSGSYSAEHLELTNEGRVVVDPDSNPVDVLRLKYTLAIERIEPFKKLYLNYAGNKLPSQVALADYIKDQGVPADDADECVATFIVNLRYLGFIRTISGADRILTVEHALEDVSRANGMRAGAVAASASGLVITADKKVVPVKEDLNTVCFYVTPIGEEESEHRRHSDLFLGTLVEPALESFGLKVVRADKIGKPGMISAHIIDYIVRAKLVVADLSFHNPNVFYELSLRHACRLPTVQIIRFSDRVPFDLQNYRTIKIDNTDIYSFVPKIESYRAEISSQVRTALENPDAVDNPISTYAPGLKLVLS